MSPDIHVYSILIMKTNFIFLGLVSASASTPSLLWSTPPRSACADLIVAVVYSVSPLPGWVDQASSMHQ